MTGAEDGVVTYRSFDCPSCNATVDEDTPVRYPVECVCGTNLYAPNWSGYSD